jgi:TPR repeat protein
VLNNMQIDTTCAAEAGEAWGMIDLGAMYRDGLGVAKDEVQAVSWFRKAAEAGNALGMASLGWMYEKGLGVERDYAQALSWYRKAAGAGDERAVNRLKELGVR